MPRRSFTGFSLALVTVLAALTVPGTFASSASAAPSRLVPEGPISVSSHSIDVTTSTGRHLQLQLRAEHGDIGVELSRGSGHSFLEDHDWDFAVLPAMRFHRDTGKGWMRAAASDLHHFGMVDLDLHQVGDWTPLACDKGSAASGRVHITGELVFRTRLSAAPPWGELGSADKPLSIDTHGQLLADQGDRPSSSTPQTLPCAQGVDWSQRLLFGASLSFAGRRFDEIDNFNFVIVPHTQADVIRFDSVSAPVPPAEVTNTDSGVTLAVTAGRAGRVTGSATLTSNDAGAQDTADCGSGKTQIVTTWDTATLTNGRDALTLHPDLGKPVVAREGNHASIDQLTVSDTPPPSPTPSPSASASATATPAP